MSLRNIVSVVVLGAIASSIGMACATGVDAPIIYRKTRTNTAGTSPSDAQVPAADAGRSEPPLLTTPTPIDDAGTMCMKVSGTELKCDGVDDDCNGVIDDLDVGHDGICDCLRIGLLGKPGSFGASDFNSWLQKKGTTVVRIQETAAEPLTATQLNELDIVMLDWVQRAYTPAETSILNTWLNSEHGLLALSGYSDDYNIKFPNSLLEPIGIQLTGPSTFSGRMLVTDFMDHPVTKDVHSVSFYGGSQVWEVAQVGTHTVFAQLDGHPVGMTYETKTARAVVWGDEWIEFDSEWSTLPDINRYWSNIINYLAPRCRVAPPPAR